MSRRNITRRQFIRMSAIITAGAVSTACTVPAPAPSAPQAVPTVQETAPEATAAKPEGAAPAAAPSKYGEAPMLAELVKAGKLPPIEERLPKDPCVIPVLEEIGQYGGTMHVLTPQPNDYADMDAFNTDGILRYAPDLKTIEPNIAKSWEFADNAKTLTLHLREGMKWSDGQPFTADDIMFQWDDVILNDDLTPVKPSDWMPGGELAKVKKVDDFTVTFQFAQPYPVALNLLAHWNGTAYNTFAPKHYMKQFHPKYADQAALDKQAKDAGFDFWYQLYNAKKDNDLGLPFNNVDLPVINAFRLKQNSPGNRDAERNPYYWKVDPEGNQLPYIDGYRLELVEDRAMVASKVATGAVDWSAKETAIKEYPLYQSNAEAGNYRVLLWQSIFGGDAIYQFNQTYAKDTVLRDIFRDIRFRQAMSLAINRDEINQKVYFGKAVPRQWTVIPASSFFEQSFADAYAQFDPEQAGKLLDEMGLDKKDADGYRLRPDGQRLSFILEYYPLESPKTPITELVVEHWKAVGVECNAKEISGELDTQRYPANEVQAGLWHGDKSTDILFPIAPQFFVPFSFGWETTYCPLWSQWYVTQGAKGEEPPEGIKNLFKTWETMKATENHDEFVRLGKEICKFQAENLLCIGTVGLGPIPVVLRKNLRNVPEQTNFGWDTLFGYYVRPETFFFKKA